MTTIKLSEIAPNFTTSDIEELRAIAYHLEKKRVNTWGKKYEDITEKMYDIETKIYDLIYDLIFKLEKREET